MAPVCLTFKIPAKFLAEIRNGLFSKSISLHSVGGLEINTSSVTQSWGNIYLLNLSSNTIFQECNFTPNVLFEMDRLTTLYSYVEQGLAASLVSDTLVKNIRGISQRNIHFYVLPTRYNHRNIYAYYKKNKFCTKAMSAFMEGLSKIAW